MKKNLYKWVYVLLAAGIALAAMMLAKSKVIETPDITLPAIMGDNSFAGYNATKLHADSFSALAKRAYGDLIAINKTGRDIKMTLTQTNQLSGDFYNNNDKLLKYKKEDYGFDIKTNKENSTVTAAFELQQGNSVTVPNDVLIKMMYKAYNK